MYSRSNWNLEVLFLFFFGESNAHTTLPDCGDGDQSSILQFDKGRVDEEPYVEMPLRIPIYFILFYFF